MDVIYEDVWTDPVAAGRMIDLPFSYRYNQLTTAAPTSATCQSTWSALCRITIHYPNHLHPLWSEPRLVLDAGGIVIDDNTFIS